MQAQQIWIILISYVMNSNKDPRNPVTLPYGELAELMGFPDRRAGHTLGRQLGIVGEYCKLNDLPALNAIVINSLTGQPGDHVVLTKGRSPRQEQAAVMSEDWFAIRVPTTGTFRKIWDTKVAK